MQKRLTDSNFFRNRKRAGRLHDSAGTRQCRNSSMQELVILEQQFRYFVFEAERLKKSGEKSWKKNWQISTEDGRTTYISLVSASPSADTESSCAQRRYKTGPYNGKSMKNFFHIIISPLGRILVSISVRPAKRPIKIKKHTKNSDIKRRKKQ